MRLSNTDSDCSFLFNSRVCNFSIYYFSSLCLSLAFLFEKAIITPLIWHNIFSMKRLAKIISSSFSISNTCVIRIIRGDSVSSFDYVYLFPNHCFSSSSSNRRDYIILALGAKFKFDMRYESNLAWLSHKDFWSPHLNCPCIGFCSFQMSISLLSVIIWWICLFALIFLMCR